MARVAKTDTVRSGKAPTRKFEAKRRAIVRSAVDEINRRGVRGMTLGSVASQLGLVPTAVIYYFKRKEDLAAEAFLAGIARFDQMISRAAIGEAEGARISAVVHAYFDDVRQIARGQADNITVFNDVRALDAPPVNEAYVEMFRHARALLGSADGLPRAHRNARAHLLLSQIFWIGVWLHQVDVADYDRAADRMSSILVDGLVAKRARWPAPVALPRMMPEEDPNGGLSNERFLKVATQLINEEGYHGASVDRIAAALKVSKGAFYHYNETKDDLVVACFQRTFDIMWRAIHSAESSSRSALQTLVSIATALIEHQMSGDAPLLRTSALTTVPESIRGELIRAMDRISYRFASILCDGVNDGSIQCADVNIAAQMITAAINAAAELQHWAPSVTAETVVAHYVRPVFEGLVSPPGA